MTMKTKGRFVPVEPSAGMPPATPLTPEAAAASAPDRPRGSFVPVDEPRQSSAKEATAALSELAPRPGAARPAPPRVEPAHGSSKAAGLLVMILFTWASLATILAAWLWWKWPEDRSQLENLPDDGIYKTSGIISPFESISSRETFRVGETKRIGNLEITPLKIENRPIRLLPDRIQSGPVLVLRLRVKNVSTDQTFRPFDPAFLYPDPKRKVQGMDEFNRRGYTYSFIHPATGFRDLIFSYDVWYERDFRIDGQDFPELKPGETAELIVASEEDALANLKAESTWRLKVRKGRLPSGKFVATVIGVTFAKEEIASAAST